jgi:hypothetical protein
MFHAYTEKFYPQKLPESRVIDNLVDGNFSIKTVGTYVCAHSVCVCVRVCVCVCLCVCIRAHIFVCMHVCIYICT